MARTAKANVLQEPNMGKHTRTLSFLPINGESAEETKKRLPSKQHATNPAPVREKKVWLGGKAKMIRNGGGLTAPKTLCRIAMEGSVAADPLKYQNTKKKYEEERRGGISGLHGGPSLNCGNAGKVGWKRGLGGKICPIAIRCEGQWDTPQLAGGGHTVQKDRKTRLKKKKKGHCCPRICGPSSETACSGKEWGFERMREFAQWHA